MTSKCGIDLGHRDMNLAHKTHNGEHLYQVILNPSMHIEDLLQRTILNELPRPWAKRPKIPKCVYEVYSRQKLEAAHPYDWILTSVKTFYDCCMNGVI
jgi:hypothetical protein